MTTKITWTHVDAHVRKACGRIGMLPVGHGDAEVAYNYLKYVESKSNLFQDEGAKMEDERDRLKIQVRQLTRQLEEKAMKPGKTKRRLDALEKAVTELRLGLADVTARRVSGAQVHDSNVPKADHFGPRDADGWYAWNGDDTIRPAGRVDVILRDCKGVHTWDADSIRWTFAKTNTDGDVIKWRPAQ